MEFNKPTPLKMTGNLSQNFRFFKQQIEIYMTATETDKKPKEIQMARLLNLMGTDALEVYNTLVSENEVDTQVSQVLDRLEKYCSHRRTEIMAHYKFFTSKQNEDSFDDYLTKLKDLIKLCNFGPLESKLLRTQIVLGIRSCCTLERLLREDMTLDQVVAFCQSVEETEKKSCERDIATIVRPRTRKPSISSTLSRQKTTINNFTSTLDIREAHSNMYKKPSSPLYANVKPETTFKNNRPAPQNEPTYYNTLTNKPAKPSQGIYSNVNYNAKPYNLYSNLAEAGKPPEKPSFKNTRYPVYDNLKPLGKNNSHCPPSPVSSSYSELQKAVSYEDDTKDFDNSSSQASKMYESIYEPINAVRPPSELSSTYSMNSLSQSITTREHETEVDSLTDLLVNSMSVNDAKKNLDSHSTSTLDWNCTKCNEKVQEEGLGCTAMGNIYHIKCFTCTHCGDQLEGKPFYHIDNKPYCEEGYLDTLEKCSVCQIPILDRILRATGRPYHPHCFRCIVCSTLLDGIPFTIDAANQIYCIDDFHKKFAPKCSVCQLPIMPEAGQDETVRFVALDRSFHVLCYRCEDCETLLGSEAEGRGCYPLDDHVLCKSCNAKRVQALTSTMITEL